MNHDPSRVGELWNREVAQRHADDVVLCAAFFKPNAAGDHELSPRGFGQRQLLKARGAYLGEGAIVAVTPLDVYAIELTLFGCVQRVVRRWSRSDLVVSTVALHGCGRDPRQRALLLSDRHGGARAEIRPRLDDSAAAEVVKLLLRHRRPLRVTPQR